MTTTITNQIRTIIKEELTQSMSTILSAIRMKEENAITASYAATLEEGRARALVMRIGNPATYGFQLYRWVKFQDGWKRAQMFQQADIPRLFSITDQIRVYEGPMKAQESKILTLAPKSYAPQNVAETFRSNNLRLYICKSKDRGVPFFVLRKGTGSEEANMNWFLKEDCDSIDALLVRAYEWFENPK